MQKIRRSPLKESTIPFKFDNVFSICMSTLCTTLSPSHASTVQVAHAIRKEFSLIPPSIRLQGRLKRASVFQKLLIVWNFSTNIVRKVHIHCKKYNNCHSYSPSSFWNNLLPFFWIYKYILFYLVNTKVVLFVSKNSRTVSTWIYSEDCNTAINCSSFLPEMLSSYSVRIYYEKKSL